MPCFLSDLKCTRCGKKYAPEIYITRCTHCDGVLEAAYDLERIGTEVTYSDLERRIPGVWKYFEFLPVSSKMNIVSLGEGGTFLHKCERLAKYIGLQNLYLKDETTNPTGAFIDRGTTVEVSKLKEFGFKSVCCGTTGNLAASLVAYSARAGLKCKVFLPQRVDVGKFYQIIAYGDDVEIVKDHEEAIEKATQESNISHLVMPNNPYFLEGKKTTGYEICEQLNWTLPDKIIVPMGSGGLLSMIWKGINELYQTGFLKNRKVKLSGTQADGCAPIVETFKKGSEEIIPADRISTIAIDIAVKEPSCGQMALRAIRESKGAAISVSDREIVDAVSLLAKLEGIFAEPASATTLAGLKKLVEEGEIDPSERVVCVITGIGLKYPEVTKTLVKGSKKLEELLRRVEGRKYTTKLGETKVHILQIMSRKESYGYEIWKVLKEEFEGKMKIPTVYQHLSELESAGLVAQSRSERVFRKTDRNYYKLTEKGKSVLIQLEKLTT
jgi:threonine synthase